jgi:two-component system CheB/CheR fusion protein
MRTSFERLGDAVLNLPVGIAIVDRRYDVLTINAAALRLLEIHRSATGEDLLHLAENVPSKPLRRVIDAAFRNLIEAEMQATLEVGGEATEHHNVHIRTFPQPPQREGGVIESVVLLINPAAAPKPGPAPAAAAPRRKGAAGQPEADLQLARIATLEEQVKSLTAANRQYQDANEDLAQSNLNLRQSNEEFLVTTEELQAASEEVETLNEELQASNEELETLNEELQATVEELNTANDDLEMRGHELQRLASSLDEQRRTIEVERARLAAILANICDAVLVIDATGVIVQTNPAYAQMFGGAEASFAPEDFAGTLLTPEGTAQGRALRGKSGVTEFAITDEDGVQREFEANGQPLWAGNAVSGGVIIIRDVTERNRLQTEFLARAAHELRTPLTSAQASLQLLISRGAKLSPLNAEHYLSIAYAQTRRLGALIGDLVDVARLQSGKLELKLETVDIAAVTRNAVDAIEPTISQRIDLKIADEPLMARGDALRLEQVIHNLLTNAAKYAPDAEAIDVRVQRQGDQAEIAIQDHGPGIAEADAARIFGRFYQVSHAGIAGPSGLGLGLFIVRQIMLGHDGNISVDTEVNKGSNFIVRLPLSGAASATEESEPEGGASDAQDTAEE